MKNSVAFVRKTIITLLLVCRALIFVLPILLYTLTPVRGFRPDQFELLMYLLLPLTCLFMAMSFKFIAQNRYQLRGANLAAGYINLSYAILLLLFILEIVLIGWKGLDNTILEDSKFFLLVSLTESGFGIYIGLYLWDIFMRKEKIS